MAIHKVCTVLGLRFGRCKNDLKTVLVKEGVTVPTDEQLKEALDRMEEVLHVIIFLYKSKKYRYGKLIEDMENDICIKRTPFKKLYLTCAVCWQGGKNKVNINTMVFLN